MRTTEGVAEKISRSLVVKVSSPFFGDLHSFADVPGAICTMDMYVLFLQRLTNQAHMVYAAPLIASRQCSLPQSFLLYPVALPGAGPPMIKVPPVVCAVASPSLHSCPS